MRPDNTRRTTRGQRNDRHHLSKRLRDQGFTAATTTAAQPPPLALAPLPPSREAGQHVKRHLRPAGQLRPSIKKAERCTVFHCRNQGRSHQDLRHDIPLGATSYRHESCYLLAVRLSGAPRSTAGILTATTKPLGQTVRQAPPTTSLKITAAQQRS